MSSEQTDKCRVESQEKCNGKGQESCGTGDQEEHSGRDLTCCQRFLNFLSLVPKDATPPDWGTLWLVFMALFASSFTLTFLFPFLPEMVETFGYSEAEKGTYVGLVASAVFAGRVVGSFFWGWLADLKGSKIVLLITIFISGVFAFIFGFVNSLPLAITFRFLGGAANGTVGVAKLVLYNISDNTNQAFHMSCISIAWGSGLILGPTVGGYLALPADKYPNVFSPTGVFADFPFALPSICCLFVCISVFIVILWKFKEPALVVNTETVVEVEDKDNTATNKDAAITETTSARPPSADVVQPLLARQLSQESAANTFSRPPVHMYMSLEMLHCDSEVLVCYGQMEIAKRRQRLLGEAGTVFQSMHSLGPDHKRQKDVLEAQPRPRSYSLGAQALRHDWQTRQKDHLWQTRQKDHCHGDEEKVTALGQVKGQNSNVKGGGHHLEVSLEVGDKTSEKPGSAKVKGSKLGACWNSVRHSSVVKLMSMRDVQHSLALYAVLSFAVIGYDEVFTVFASTDKEYGGLNFSTDKIGLALGAVSIPLMFIQIKVFPLLVAKFGLKRSYVICSFFMFIPCQLIPLLRLIVNDNVWLWVCLMTLTLPLRVAVNSMFAGSSLFINNSVSSADAGKVNGLGMTFSALARTVASSLGGSLFAWSVKLNQLYGSPLDTAMSFVFFGFIVFLTSLQCILLPDNLDNQKK